MTFAISISVAIKLKIDKGHQQDMYAIKAPTRFSFITIAKIIIMYYNFIASIVKY